MGALVSGSAAKAPNGFAADESFAVPVRGTATCASSRIKAVYDTVNALRQKKLVAGRISLSQRPPLDAGTAEDGFLPTGTSPASLLIPSRRVDTVMDSMTRAPAMPSASSVWCDQTPL
jgi:hypothetical protein